MINIIAPDLFKTPLMKLLRLFAFLSTICLTFAVSHESHIDKTGKRNSCYFNTVQAVAHCTNWIDKVEEKDIEEVKFLSKAITVLKITSLHSRQPSQKGYTIEPTTLFGQVPFFVLYGRLLI